MAVTSGAHATTQIINDDLDSVPVDPDPKATDEASDLAQLKEATILHGLRQDIDERKKYAERIFWLVAGWLAAMAMLWKPETERAMKWEPAPEWKAFQRRWVRPAIIHAAA